MLFFPHYTLFGNQALGCNLLIISTFILNGWGTCLCGRSHSGCWRCPGIFSQLAEVNGVEVLHNRDLQAGQIIDGIPVDAALLMPVSEPGKQAGEKSRISE